MIVELSYLFIFIFLNVVHNHYCFKLIQMVKEMEGPRLFVDNSDARQARREPRRQHLGLLGVSTKHRKTTRVDRSNICSYRSTKP